MEKLRLWGWRGRGVWMIVRRGGCAIGEKSVWNVWMEKSGAFDAVPRMGMAFLSLLVDGRAMSMIVDFYDTS